MLVVVIVDLVRSCILKCRRRKREKKEKCYTNGLTLSYLRKCGKNLVGNVYAEMDSTQRGGVLLVLVGLAPDLFRVLRGDHATLLLELLDVLAKVLVLQRNTVAQVVISVHVDRLVQADRQADIADRGGFFQVPVVDRDLGRGAVLEHARGNLVQHVGVGDDGLFFEVATIFF